MCTRVRVYACTCAHARTRVHTHARVHARTRGHIRTAGLSDLASRPLVHVLYKASGRLYSTSASEQLARPAIPRLECQLAMSTWNERIRAAINVTRMELLHSRYLTTIWLVVTATVLVIIISQSCITVVNGPTELHLRSGTSPISW